MQIGAIDQDHVVRRNTLTKRYDVLDQLVESILRREKGCSAAQIAAKRLRGSR